MRLRYKVIIIGISLIVSCVNKSQNNDKEIAESASKTPKEISVKAIENFKYNDYILSADAENEIRNWRRFNELNTQISFLKKADITFFTTEKDTLKKFLDSLKINIPEGINTYPVNARLIALETKLLKLNNDLVLDNYPVESKLESIKALLEANSNLIFVINKKLEFDKNDIQRPD